MNELHIFAGIGGGILGGEILGHTTVCAVEIEDYPRRVLLQRQIDGLLPEFPIWDDVQTFDGTPWRGSVDVVCGGFPCQDISSAGTGAGIEGARSRLWKEYKRIVGEVRPKFVFAENSPMLRTRGLVTVLKDLAELGYDAKWCVLGSGDIKAPHQRKRMWVLATDTDVSQCERSSVSSGGKACDEIPCMDIRRRNKPTFHGVDDGTPRRVDRLKAIGNAQDPFVAALAWRILSQNIKTS